MSVQGRPCWSPCLLRTLPVAGDRPTHVNAAPKLTPWRSATTLGRRRDWDLGVHCCVAQSRPFTCPARIWLALQEPCCGSGGQRGSVAPQQTAAESRTQARPLT